MAQLLPVAAVEQLPGLRVELAVGAAGSGERLTALRSRLGRGVRPWGRRGVRAFYPRAQNPQFHDLVQTAPREAGATVHTVLEAYDWISLLSAVAEGRAFAVVSSTLAALTHHDDGRRAHQRIRTRLTNAVFAAV